jgi:hypothetical protein
MGTLLHVVTQFQPVWGAAIISQNTKAGTMAMLLRVQQNPAVWSVALFKAGIFKANTALL